ncbi:zona pellucida sperm-binding protein 3-like [Mustelus asterias]
MAVTLETMAQRFPQDLFLDDGTSQTVMVQCGEDNLLIKVQLDLFGTRHLIKATDLTLGTAGCQPTRIYTRNHTVLFDYGLHECGSTLQMTQDFLIYSTYLKHTPAYHGSVIVRTNGAVVPIECHYFRKANVSSNPIKPTWIPFSSTRSGQGHLSFSLRLMNDDWLTERTSTVYYLGDLIHIEASVSMTNHMPLKLYIDRCVATLSPNKDSTPRYHIIDYYGCLLDSKAEDSFSTFVLPRDEQELDKLRFDLDAFRFFGDDHLIFITCQLKVAPVDRKDSRNKACTFQKIQNVWTSLESNNNICTCCHVNNCGAIRELQFPFRGRKDLVEAGKTLIPIDIGGLPLPPLTGVVYTAESEAGLNWEDQISLGPLIILDTSVTNLTTESVNEAEQRMQERSPGIDGNGTLQKRSYQRNSKFQTTVKLEFPIQFFVDRTEVDTDSRLDDYRKDDWDFETMLQVSQWLKDHVGPDSAVVMTIKLPAFTIGN